MPIETVTGVSTYPMWNRAMPRTGARVVPLSCQVQLDRARPSYDA